MRKDPQWFPIHIHSESCRQLTYAWQFFKISMNIFFDTYNYFPKLLTHQRTHNTQLIKQFMLKITHCKLNSNTN